MFASQKYTISAVIIGTLVEKTQHVCYVITAICILTHVTQMTNGFLIDFRERAMI